MQPAILLDRDGVINRDKGFVSDRKDFEYIEGAVQAMRQWAAAGYRLIVITNQSGIGRGYYTQNDFEKLNQWMLADLKTKGITIDAVYHCPHAPEDRCGCRKPAPGMIRQAVDEHAIDLSKSWLVGDKMSDIDAGRNAGIANLVIVRSGQFRQMTLEANDVKIMEDLKATCKLIPKQKV